MAQSSSEHTIPLAILDDLCSRFIINVPEEEQQNLIRICFQIELAYWFYLDFYCTAQSHINEEEPKLLKKCAMREFAAHVFQHLPYLKEHYSKLDEILEKWRGYKQYVPTYGAILLDSDLSHVLLVQSYLARPSWGFPKGKVNAEEDPVHCAVREVMEETGYDISRLIDRNVYLETTIHEQMVRLYIVKGISRETKFHPRTRNEIKSVEWFCIEDLPVGKKDMTFKEKCGMNPNFFFMVVPFVKRLKRWIVENQQKKSQGSTTRRSRNRSGSESEPKNRKHQQFSQSIQLEMQDFEALKKWPKENVSSSPPPRNAQRMEGNSRLQKPSYKRQLFCNDDDDEPEVKDKIDYTDLENFRAPSWQNFRLDYASILACLAE